MTLKALIFDVDGTIADTERDGHREAFNLAFKEVGLKWEWSEAVYGELLGVGGGYERMVAYARYYQQQPVSDKVLQAAHQHKARYFTELVAAGNVPLRSGIKRLFQETKDAGLALAVATNCSSFSLRALTTSLLDAEPEDVFSVQVTGDNLQHKKPHPSAYHNALKGLDLPACECMAFEDSFIGLQSSLANELVTVVTSNDYTAREDFTGSPLVLSELGEQSQPCQTLHDEHDIGPVQWFSVDTAMRLHAAT